MSALRRACLTTLIALVAQFSLGMTINLYVPVPASDQHAGFTQEIKTAPFALTVHVLLGIALIISATVVLIRAAKVRDRPMTTLAITGLAAILGAFAAGEMFVRNGENSASLWMAILTGGALVCYISALGRISMAPGRRRLHSLPEETAGGPEADYAPPVPLPQRAPSANGPWQTGPQRVPWAGYPPSPRTPWPPRQATLPYRPEPPAPPAPPAWQNAAPQWHEGE